MMSCLSVRNGCLGALGRAGDDELKGSSVRANAVFGGTGNDEIETGSESYLPMAEPDMQQQHLMVDYVYGGAGDDQIMAGLMTTKLMQSGDTVYMAACRHHLWSCR